FSAKRPHKNLARLLEALSQLDQRIRPILIMPGYPTEYERHLRQLASDLGLENDARFLAWISDDECEAFYKLAAGFIFPSLYEGFGLPILEAMGRGIPVACSNRPPLREVAGDAALLFDAEKPLDIAAAIRRLLSDQRELNRL